MKLDKCQDGTKNIHPYHVQVLANDVISHQPEFEAVKAAAQDISRSTGDGRTASYAQQLVSRFQTLAGSVEVWTLTSCTNLLASYLNVTNTLYKTVITKAPDYKLY